MSSSRRDFLVGGLSAGAATPLVAPHVMPQWLSAAGNAVMGDEVLVVIQIRGGWDFLNMLVKPGDPTYNAARPNLKLPASKLLALTGQTGYGFHPAMTAFRDLYNRGDLAVIRNVGYPKPNLSHFASEKKWAAADPSTVKHGTGWLAKWLAQYQHGFQIPAILLGGVSNSFIGARVPSITSSTALTPRFDPRTARDSKLSKLAMLVNSVVARDPLDPYATHAAQTTVDALQAADLFEIAGKNYRSKVTYPTDTLSRRLQLAARYITAGMPTQVYYANTGGYDTHSNQGAVNQPEAGRLATLLTRLSASLKAFLEDMRLHGKADKVVVMLYSEFGRRIGENGSLGTDHGHGGVAMLAGKPVKGGMYGKFPNLSVYKAPFTRKYLLFNNDSTDFRRMYAEVLDRWLKIDSNKALGGKFAPLGFL